VLSIAAFLGHLVKRSIYGDSPLSLAEQIECMGDEKQPAELPTYQSYPSSCQASPLSASRASTPPLNADVSRAPSLSSAPSFMGRSTGTPPVFAPVNSAQFTPRGSIPSLSNSGHRFPAPTACPLYSGSRSRQIPPSNSKTFRI